MNAVSPLDPTLFLHLDTRKKATERLAKATLPSVQEEAWRKIHLERRADLSFFSITNSQSDVQGSLPERGVRLFSFKKAAREPQLRKVIQEYWEQSLANASDYFALQNLAQWNEGCVVQITPDVDGPVIFRHFPLKGNAVAHRLLFCLSENTEVTIIEKFTSNADSGTDESREQSNAGLQPIYWNTISTAYVSPNANLRYLSIRDFADNDHHFMRFFSEQKRDSRVFAGVAHCGGLIGKGFLTARFLEPNTEFRGVGIYAGTGKEFHDMEMLADHRCKYSRSSLLYKAVVRQQAHSVFDGKLIIPKGVSSVDSHQTNHNILLDPQARAESMPRLVVQAEDVSCEHGATVGVLDPEILFYLQTRGLSETEARYLMIEGFFNEAIQEFPLDSEEQSHLLAAFKRRLKL